LDYLEVRVAADDERADTPRHCIVTFIGLAEVLARYLARIPVALLADIAESCGDVGADRPTIP
jgi:hypothetical protein